MVFQKNTMNDGTVEVFDGMTLICWSDDEKLSFLNESRQQPGVTVSVPVFRF